MDSQDSSIELRQKLKVELDRFIEILHELYGFYLDACHGFELYENQTRNKLYLPGLIIAHGNPDDPDAIILNSSSWNEISIRNQKDGTNTEKTRQYLLTMILEHWNHDIRKKIAIVFGIEDPNDIKSDIMGDLNKIRNDLLHARGKADNSARGIKIRFKKDEQIKITEEIFNKIFSEIFSYFNELALQKTGFILYLDRSLNQKAKDIHRSMKHVCINPEAKQKFNPEKEA